ncbi:MAG: DNA mismatch repair protein MutS [Flavobacteriaceae bacterium]|nr:DNA mismatch repair protein MutS [Flavobacteriaceae bacterium]PHX83561.1 MAG: DNA mismatch repair protein MutS [Flavobacteriales bacterium]
MATKTSETPLMTQYNALKAEYPEALLLFRVGDFYETFGDDAVAASKALDIVLTKRANGAASSIPLAGFPHHSLDAYMPRLVRAGFKVAICEQLEDPKTVKGIVKRGVTELVTPGIAHHETLLQAKRNNFLAALHADGPTIGLALVDVSTGECFAAEGPLSEIDPWLQSFRPSEVVFNRRADRDDLKRLMGNAVPSGLEDWVFAKEFATRSLTEHFGTSSLKGFGLDDAPCAVIASGALLHYLRQAVYANWSHLERIQRLRPATHLWMDGFTARNLELFGSAQPGGLGLVDVLDRTANPMGARLLRRWLAMPLLDPDALKSRHDAVAWALDQQEPAQRSAAVLGELPDLERMATRLATGRLGPRDLKALAHCVGRINELASELNGAEPLHHLLEALDPLTDWCQMIQSTLSENPPALLVKGGAIAVGVNADLDRYRSLKQDARGLLEAILHSESERSGIPSLKLDFNSVFGYYLEVRNSHKDRVPQDWIRKQTLVNAERYITPELKEQEEGILQAGERIGSLEAQIFAELLSRAQKELPALLRNARAMAELDVLLNFALLARRHRWVRPTFGVNPPQSKTKGNQPSDPSPMTWKVRAGRHPVIESSLPEDRPYIANDVHLSSDGERIWILTGPNMSGKSALLRQTALQAVMAQIGCFVAADQAELPLLDRIFVRVGASDNLSGGESTFMVEMAETASILNGLTSRSLVLLDEIGRGTATYDGLSIAQAIAEFVHDHPHKPLVLFATHYHELNDLAKDYPGIANRHVRIKEVDGRIVFLRTLAEGGTSHSFGIEVARMAGMPPSVVLRAHSLLSALEQAADREKSAKSSDSSGLQLSFIQWEDPKAQTWQSELAELDPNTIAPMDALLLLQRWKKEFGS